MSSVDMSVDLGFLKLRNPVLAASGTFGYGTEFFPFLDPAELGGFVVKGLYYEPRSGNPPPRLVETASGLINAIGLQGIGVKAFCRDVLPQIRDCGTEVLVNVCGSDEEEYARVAAELDRHPGISAYELNISCPNVREGGRCPALTPESTHSVVRRVKTACGRPLITKLSPNVTDIVSIARAAEEAGSDGLSLVNTFLAMSIDPGTRRPKLANVLGGLSGPAVKPIALRMVYQVACAVDIPVMGMGGIFTGEDAAEFLLAGASAVQVGTANFIDPAAAVRIVRELTGWAAAQGESRIADIIGRLNT